MSSAALSIVDQRFGPEGAKKDFVIIDAPKGWSLARRARRPLDTAIREADAPDVAEHFVFDYVLLRPRPNFRWPHVMEITLRHAALQWPYMLDMEWIWAIKDTYASYFKRPSCSAYPALVGPAGWFYINIILHSSELVAYARTLPSTELTQEPPTFPTPGLLLSFSQLRVGYHWGGLFEKVLRIDIFDMRGLSATLESPLAGSELISPVRFVLEMKRVAPPAGWPTGSDTSLSVHLGRFDVRPAFRALPLYQATRVLLEGQLAAKKAAALALSLQVPVAPTNTSPSKFAVSVRIKGLSVIFVDDRSGHPFDVLSFDIQSLKMDFQKNSAPPKLPAQLAQLAPAPFQALVSGAVRLQMSGRYLNNASGCLEPYLDVIPVAADAKIAGATTNYEIYSDRDFGFTVNADVVRAASDAARFCRGLLHPEDSVASFNTSGNEESPGGYLIHNCSGVRLLYWSAAPAPGRQPFLLEPDTEPGMLLCSPCEKAISLHGAQVQAQTIAVQFEGLNWTPVTDVPVDCVGKHLRLVVSPLAVSSPVVFDVQLKGRQKILTIHSPIRLVNRLSVRLSCWVRSADPSLSGAPHGSGKPRKVTIDVGQDAYVPVYLPARVGLLSIQPDGFKQAEKEVIRLDPAELDLQQGKFTTGSLDAEGKGVFTCCLQVSKHVHFVNNTALHEFDLTFEPHLTIENALPYAALFRVYDHHNDELGALKLEAGERQGFCKYTGDRNIYVSIEGKRQNYFFRAPSSRLHVFYSVCLYFG